MSNKPSFDTICLVLGGIAVLVAATTLIALTVMLTLRG